MTIDDPCINFTLAGFFGPPDEHIRWIHPLAGLLLKNLYSLNGAVPWFCLFHLTLISCGLSFVMYSLLQTHELAEAVALFAIFFMVDAAFLSSLQFTSTAFVVAQGAMALLLAYAKTEQLKLRKELLVLASLLFLVCFMVRWRVAEISLVISAGFLFLCSSAIPPKNAKAALYTLAISLMLGELLHLGFVLDYEINAAWRGFFRWHETVNQFADFDHVNPTKAELKNAHWSENDLSMMKNFMFLDSSVFNNQTAQKILASSKTTFRASLNPDYFVRELNRVLLDSKSLVSLAAFLMVNFTLFSKPKDWLMNLIPVSIILVIDGLLICFLKAPQYVFTPLFGFPLVTIMLRARQGFLSTQSKRIIFLVLALILASSVIVMQQDEARRAKNRRTILLREIEKIAPNSKEFYLLLPFSFPIANIDPLGNPIEILNGLNFDFSSRIYPLKKRIITGFGSTDLRSLIGNPNSRFAASDYLDSINQIVRFCAEHYRYEVKFKQVYHSQELHYGIYQPQLNESRE